MARKTRAQFEKENKELRDIIERYCQPTYQYACNAFGVKVPTRRCVICSVEEFTENRGRNTPTGMRHLSHCYFVKEKKERHLRDVVTTPIENRLAAADVLVPYARDRNALFIVKHRLGYKAVPFYKALYGRQARCVQGEFRYWVWEGRIGESAYRLYVSNTKGMVFEVEEDLTAGEAISLWQRFYVEIRTRTKKLRKKQKGPGGR